VILTLGLIDYGGKLDWVADVHGDPGGKWKIGQETERSHNDKPWQAEDHRKRVKPEKRAKSQTLG